MKLPESKIEHSPQSLLDTRTFAATQVALVSFLHYNVSGSTVRMTLAASHQLFRDIIKRHGRTPLDE
jgi:hypothetical protein